MYEFPKGGNFPVRSQGSRWIGHKRKALQRFVDRFGAYINHLATLIEDKSIKGNDRAKIKGYLQKWKHARMLIGSALYVDVLKPACCLSRSLQCDQLLPESRLFSKQVNHYRECPNKIRQNGPLLSWFALE